VENLVRQQVEKLLAGMQLRDPDLHAEVNRKIGGRSLGEQIAEARAAGGATLAEVAGVEPEATAANASRVAETIVRRLSRPVLLIRDNLFVPEFAADSEVWRERLANAAAGINTAIPSVGRIEVPGLGFPFVGTGWLIADDVLVTNRHVASEFARRDGQRFVFRSFGGGPLNGQVDFFEEHQRPDSREFPLTEVLWIAGPSDADIAFFRVARSALGRSLTLPIPLLGAAPVKDQLVAVIGYPARDGGFPEQDLMEQIFGDVFDKKRLAPGQIMQVSAGEIEHDCTTLGGNSGSVVLDLDSGRAVGLHFAGQIFTANFAVAASTVNERFNQLLRGELARAADVRSADPPGSAPAAGAGVQAGSVPAGSQPGGAVTATFQIPVEITVRIGGVLQTVSPATGGLIGGGAIAGSTGGADLDAALAEARAYLRHDGDVLAVRLGYRFRRGWITQERAIVIEVKEKLPPFALRDLGKAPYPVQFRGVGVDVRTAPMADRLSAEGVVLPVVTEAVRPGNYVPPPDLRLLPVDEPMRAIFHVSPDSAFPNLSAFLARTERRLIATMYESGARHVRNALVAAVGDGNDHLRMVTDRKSGMVELVGDLHHTLHERFDHQWASVGGGELLFPTAYHIKVAVRDRQEMWLSSGNWKDSNQPDIHPAADGETSFRPLREHNREWHAIIDNAALASQYDAFLEYDFREAERVPAPEAVAPALDLFVPLDLEPEARVRAQYFPPLEVDRRLRIQPLLTPDNYARHVLEVLDSARESILFENQSFNLLNENEPDVEELFTLIKDKQRSCEVQIILRDAREFGSGASQQVLLERLQDFGFDMDNIRLQRGCHTKGIVVDSSIVVLGSHNWTNTGMLYNRDASLVVFDAEVAEYFERIFRFDWRFLAKQQAEESVAAARLAAPGEPTPAGMRRVSVSEFLDSVG
jgi:hypothetical protein